MATREEIAAAAVKIRGALVKNGVLPGVRAAEFFEVKNDNLVICRFDSLDVDALKKLEWRLDIVAIRDLGVFAIGADNCDAAAKLKAAENGGRAEKGRYV